MKANLSDIVGNKGIFTDGDWVESKDQDPSGDVRLIQLADVGDGYFINKSSRFLTSDKARQLRCTFLQQGDILIARMPDPLGRACIYPGIGQQAVTVVDVAIVRPADDQVFTPWLCHMINSPSFRNEVGNWSSGTTRNRISRKNLDKILFHVPPLDEQKRIATILDKADQLRQKRRQAITLLDSIGSVLIEEVATQASNRTIALGDCLSFVTSGGRNWSRYYAETGDRFIRSLDVQMNFLGNEDIVYVQAPDNAEARRTRTQSGDVLLTITGSRIGRVAALKDEQSRSYVSQHVAILRPIISKISSEFLSFFLSSAAGQQQIAKWQYGQTKPGLNFEQIRSFEIPDVDMDIQNRFVTKVQTIAARLAKCNNQGAILDSLFSSLQHRAFSGQL
ncbi:type I restriction enzyme S subunit [Ancylobacter sp. 3268]|uniref:restriction endonuclease subunit S n=1 Tax=Ancylobacter sp. 3268 TaxID=2817752 RepID=UPI00285E337B|nr:restriction endonuclease subunit S [Ancylobacter sp. 3268]MDR6955544.1 type I restriction enzyme S subunit [Ancylobacter sp. 3268]